MILETTTCEDCGNELHQITIPNELIFFDGEDFCLNLDNDELADLYFTLKEVQCQ